MVKREILNAEGSLMIVRVDLQAGFIGDLDQHPEEQASYIEKGKVEFSIDGEKKLLSKGDVLYIPSDVPHQVHVLEECTIIDVFTPIRQDLLK